jgi:hypothetical protein
VRAAVKVVGMVAGERQHIVAYAMVGDPVLLVPQPDNPHDPNAIAVYTCPRSALTEPVVSSLREEVAHVGIVGDADRALLLDRQAGYVPRTFAATVALPPKGIVGYVSDVRWSPPEYGPDGTELERRVAGFDVMAAWPRRPDPSIDVDLEAP